MTDPNKDVCNPTVFESIFNEHAKNLRRFVFYKTRDFASAEDIVQDVFVKLWKDCAKITFDTVKSLLYTMANNSFINQLNQKKVALKHQDTFSKKSTQESPEFLMLEQEFMEKLNRAIASLPDKQREVFIMSRIEKKKYKEISNTLGISVKAVEKRMHKAILSLKEKVDEL